MGVKKIVIEKIKGILTSKNPVFYFIHPISRQKHQKTGCMAFIRYAIDYQPQITLKEFLVYVLKEVKLT